MRYVAYLHSLPAVCLITLKTHPASAFIYNVVPDAGSSDSVNEVYSLLDALDRAVGGDTVSLADGTYSDQIHSTGPGEEGNPIVITGSRQVVLKANNPCVEITHSWITIEGFSVDGKTGSDDEQTDSYENKCVRVDSMGESEDEALDGFVMRNMLVQNCGGECVRLKNFVVNAHIVDNTIQDCGVHDYVIGNDPDGKNGEGIYIGTSINQWEEFGEDRCDNNLIRGNTIITNGNECVEVKEGSSGNMIEENDCTSQHDSESGCYVSRGDENTIRNNNATDCRGAGVRLGGGTDQENNYIYGRMNNVYGNTFVRAVEAAITVRVLPQGQICGNICEDGPCDIEKDEDVGEIEDTWNAPCEQTPNHQAPVPNTPSPEPETQAPLATTTEAPAPVPGTPSPTVNAPAPVANTPSPQSETLSPVISTPSPSFQSPAPSESTTSPVTKTASPVVETSRPVFSTPSPALETPTPVERTPSPVDDKALPGQDTMSPVSSTRSPTPGPPSSSNSTPTPSAGSPRSGGSTPSPALSTPSPVEDTPSPTTGTSAPVGRRQQGPSFETPSPSISMPSPPTGTLFPATSTPSPSSETISPSGGTPSPVLRTDSPVFVDDSNSFSYDYDSFDGDDYGFEGDDDFVDVEFDDDRGYESGYDEGARGDDDELVEIGFEGYFGRDDDDSGTEDDDRLAVR